MKSSLKRAFSIPVLLAVAALLVAASCEREPTKSDYVSARVTEICKDRELQALQACRIAVINRFKDTPFEEMKRRYPKPVSRQRHACSFAPANEVPR